MYGQPQFAAAPVPVVGAPVVYGAAPQVMAPQYAAPMTQPQNFAPGGRMWAPAPVQVVPPNCPRGLEYLLGVDSIVVKQETDMAEQCLGVVNPNKYLLLNHAEQQIFAAEEQDGGCLSRNLLKSNRGFEMSVTNNSNQEVFKIVRPYKCPTRTCMFMPCQLQEIEISAGGQTIGYVKQMPHIKDVIFDICNSNQQPILKIKQPDPCKCFCCSKVEFPITSYDEQNKLGSISKDNIDAREIFTGAQTFCVAFPCDLDVQMKATVIAASLLVDYMFYEN